MNDGPLIRLSGVSRVYGDGPTQVTALKDVDLDIHAGEFVAIVGSSGSGKSTLMNLLGCLDRPSAGTYSFRGQDVGSLDPDARAALRRTGFGFVFQQYNLIGNADARANIEMPAIYAGHGRGERRERSARLLARLGLAERGHHRPSALSGGQQQRVSIARALVNDAEVILADEPTGALDTATGVEVLALLRDLNRDGRTIILITHDREVAAAADRRIEIADGRIVADTGRAPAPDGGHEAGHDAVAPGHLPLSEAAAIAWRALAANWVRTGLTLLGIVIGVGAVIVMLAIGDGARDSVVSRISAMGSDLLVLRPGAPGQRGDTTTLTVEDADAIAGIAGVASAVPELSGSQTLRAGLNDVRTQILATSADYDEVQNWPAASGRFFDARDVADYAPVVVLGETVAKALFPDGADPVGQWILTPNLPLQVVGVLSPKGATNWGSDRDDVAMVPITTGQLRLIGQRHLRSVSIKVADVARIDEIEAEVEALILQRHQIRDFSIRNMASLLETVQETQNTLTVLLGSIAAVSLLVGGIGVMNIMLVSVSERTREIGVRMATGARPRDVMTQFLVEALVVCALGAGLGVALGLAATWAIGQLGTPIAFSLSPVAGAVGCALAIGIAFGLMPARRAANLDPVRALASE